MTLIHAPPEICFDNARSIDVHVASMKRSGERAVAGRTSGLIGPGETVTWRARHFGIRQHFTSELTAFDRPHHFQDSMRRGAFARFVHDHYFQPSKGATLMRDVVDFQSPGGVLGRLVDVLVMYRYLSAVLRQRAREIKSASEPPA